MTLPDATPDAATLARAERAGIDLRRPYRCQRYPSGALLFTQEIAAPPDRPEGEGRVRRVVVGRLRAIPA